MVKTSAIIKHKIIWSGLCCNIIIFLKAILSKISCTGNRINVGIKITSLSSSQPKDVYCMTLTSPSFFRTTGSLLRLKSAIKITCVINIVEVFIINFNNCCRLNIKIEHIVMYINWRDNKTRHMYERVLKQINISKL